MSPEFETRIQGIPCRIRIDYYEPGEPGDMCCAPTGPTVDYTVLDRKGYPAAWLERKMTSEDREQIYEECVHYMEYLAEEAAVEAALRNLEYY